MRYRDKSQSIEDDFFQTLAGNASKQKSALILREIIKDQVELDIALKKQHNLDPTFKTNAQIKDLKKKLSTENKTSSKNNSWFDQCKKSILTIFNSLSTIEAVGAFTSISFAIVGAAILFNSSDNKLPIDHYSVRLVKNHKTIVVITQNPNDLINMLRRKLTEIQVEYNANNLSNNEWYVEVNPKSRREINQTRGILEYIDSDTLEAPPYYIHIKKAD